LLRDHQLRLFSYAKGVTGDRDAAFDIVQDTFVRAVSNIASLRDDSKFSSWLFGITHQRCMHYFRRAKREAEIFAGDAEIGDFESHGPDPRQAMVSFELAEAVFDAIEKLPLHQRAALLLHVLGGFSLEDISGISGAPVGTVKSRLHHAKRVLRRLLAEGDRP
jgi:RNA polymerase sigma-70 factor (ECF subfamily)